MLRDLCIGGGRVAAVVAAVAATVSVADASGVGASIYVAPKAKPAVRRASYDATVAPPVASCVECQRNGFACMKHLGVGPCDAEGNCVPNRPNYGYYEARWRRWPGTETDERRPEPAVEGDDSLVPAIVPPAPEEEDRQAPPPIDQGDEEPSESPLDAGGFDPAAVAPGGGVEIDLPPLPEGPMPAPRPALPNFQPPGQPVAPPPGVQPQQQPEPRREGPPGLPFGFHSGGGERPVATRLPTTTDEGAPPSLPFGTRPASNGEASRDDAPPELPSGFTALRPSNLLKRLPRLLPGGESPRRADPSVVPTAAYAPVR